MIYTASKTASESKAAIWAIETVEQLPLVHIAPRVVLHPVKGDGPQEGLRNAEGVHKVESLRPELPTEAGYFGADEL